MPCKSGLSKSSSKSPHTDPYLDREKSGLEACLLQSARGLSAPDTSHPHLAKRRRYMGHPLWWVIWSCSCGKVEFLVTPALAGPQEGLSELAETADLSTALPRISCGVWRRW